MAETVFILGAGASKAGGAPLMWDFLDRAQDLWARGAVRAEDQDHFRRVFELIGALQIANSKARVDLVNIEALFNTLEMAKLIRPKIPTETTPEQAIESLRVVIAATLELTAKFAYSSGQGYASPQPYEQFVDLVRYLRRDAHPMQTVALLTFNYDVGLDHALGRAGLPYDYHLTHQVAAGAIPLLKLHGSLNWAIRDQEELEIVPWRMERYTQILQTPFDDGPHSLTPRFHFQHLSERDLAGAALKTSPFIVPPTWNKSDHHQAIQPVWQRAALELSEAANIIVIGYSLPETDGFFRGLYALGTIGPVPLRRFWVVDPGDPSVIQSRFKTMLGAGADNRFEHIALPFEGSLPRLRAAFPARK